MGTEAEGLDRTNGRARPAAEHDSTAPDDPNGRIVHRSTERTDVTGPAGACADAVDAGCGGTTGPEPAENNESAARSRGDHFAADRRGHVPGQEARFGGNQ